MFAKIIEELFTYYNNVGPFVEIFQIKLQLKLTLLIDL